VPPPWPVTALIVSPGSLEVILICCAGKLGAVVSVIVAMLVETPLATIEGGVRVRVMFGVTFAAGAVWVRVFVAVRLWDPRVTVAVIVAWPGVVELVTVAVNVPSPWPVTLLIVSPGSLEVIVMFCGESRPKRVTVAVAVLVDVPSATIDAGFSVSVTCGGRPAAVASAASPHQLRHVDRTTAPTR
jgi:hypothetical protein